jgi:hypothetical protein
VDKLAPIRFEKRDLAILELFGPKHRFEYLTARGLSCQTNRPLNSLQHRLQKLYHHGYLGRWHPPHTYTGGSQPCVYYLDERGATALRKHANQTVKAKRIGEGFHPFLMHTVLLNEIRGIIRRAAAERDLVVPYDFLDREFVDRFRAQRRSSSDRGEAQRDTMYHLVPDWVFAFSGGYDQQGNPLEVRNFLLELQRNKGAVKNPKRLRSRYKSLRHRLEGYYYFYKQRRWSAWAPVKKRKYAVIREPHNFRVLFVTEGMSHEEHSNLIALARDIDEKKIGLRLFLFLRFEELDQNPVQRIVEPIWRSPVATDRPLSIFS